MTESAHTARIIAESILEAARASDLSKGQSKVIAVISAGLIMAAGELERQFQAAAEKMAAGHQCSIDHRSLKTPKCPACGVPKGSA